MTPKIIELNQAPVTLVELPEGSIKPHLSIVRAPDILYITYHKKSGGGYMQKNIRLPRGNITMLGILSDLTEEQFAECVDKVNFESGPVYKNYKTFKGLGKASEAFDTLIESEKVYTENPLEKVAKSIGHGTLDNFDQDYAEAQSRTIDPTRTVVLLRKED